jgi:hypothetical protein
MGERKKTLEDERLLSLLEEACHRLGISVRYERLEGGDCSIADGFCRIKGQSFVFIDRRRTVREKICILREVVGRTNAEAAYLPPIVRELVEEEKTGRKSQKNLDMDP